jgi:CHASE3 domain sensor protein
MPFLRPTLAGICTLLLLTAAMTIYSFNRVRQVHETLAERREVQAGLVVINCRWKDEGGVSG